MFILVTTWKSGIASLLDSLLCWSFWGSLSDLGHKNVYCKVENVKIYVLKATHPPNLVDVSFLFLYYRWPYNILLIIIVAKQFNLRAHVFLLRAKSMSNWCTRKKKLIWDKDNGKTKYLLTIVKWMDTIGGIYLNMMISVSLIYLEPVHI